MAVSIVYAVARQIAEHALSEAPNEACGILAGTRERISRAIPLENASEAPASHFRFDPNEQLAALKSLDAAGLGWVGVYHSHPKTPPIPSREDIVAAVDHSLLQLIVSALSRSSVSLRSARRPLISDPSRSSVSLRSALVA